MLDPLARDLRQYLPAPRDYFLDTDGSLRNYTDSNFIRNLERRLTTRVDHNLTARTRLTARYTQVPIRGDRGRGDFCDRTGRWVDHHRETGVHVPADRDRADWKRGDSKRDPREPRRRDEQHRG